MWKLPWVHENKIPVELFFYNKGVHEYNGSMQFCKISFICIKYLDYPADTAPMYTFHEAVELRCVLRQGALLDVRARQTQGRLLFREGLSSVQGIELGLQVLQSRLQRDGVKQRHGRHGSESQN